MVLEKSSFALKRAKLGNEGTKHLDQPLALCELLQHVLGFLLPHLLAFELINQVQNICGRGKAGF